MEQDQGFFDTQLLELFFKMIRKKSR